MSAAPAVENRTSPRRLTLKGGSIVFNGGRSTIDCKVRNMSAGGAKLVVASSFGVPERFELAVSGEPRRPCRIAWRTLTEIGVAYEASAAA